MKTILIGYERANDKTGENKSKLIAGPEVATVKQWEIFKAAKRNHEFPKGIQHLEIYHLGTQFGEPEGTAVYISDEVAKFVQQDNAKRDAEFKSRREAKEAADRDAADHFKAAQRAIKIAAMERNDLAVKLSAAKEAARASGGKDVDTKKVTELQAQVEAAVEAFKVVLVNFNIVKNPKASADEKAKALVALKIIPA